MSLGERLCVAVGLGLLIALAAALLASALGPIVAPGQGGVGGDMPAEPVDDAR